jgi:hypothetical protein
MDANVVAARRFAAQHITKPAKGIADLVRSLGAMQAQDPLACKWAVGLRLGGRVTEADVDDALATGALVRTHTLRGTWQLVAPEDVRWQVSLVAPRVIAKTAARHRQLGLTDKIFAKANAVLSRALEERDLDRKELALALKDGGIRADGVKLSHLLGRAELEGIVCGGPRRGSSPCGRSWIATSAPTARSRSTRRGPSSRGATSTRGVHLLPAFDEYVVAYRDRSAILDAPDARYVGTDNGILGPFLVVDGRVVGTWSRALGKKGVDVVVKPFPSRAAVVRPRKAELEEAARAYGRFLGLDATLTLRR